jgi:hypothetical protein
LVVPGMLTELTVSVDFIVQVQHFALLDGSSS